MRRIRMPPGNDDERVEVLPTRGARLARPTASGLAAAAASLFLLAALSVLLLVPTVFFLVPLSPEADAVTLCLPGIGPLQQFRDDLEGQQEEVVHIHERVHAQQCRMFGATWYALQTATPGGRLTLEVQALCAEAVVLAGRGASRERLLDRTVETLASGYFRDGAVAHRDISAAVDGACGGLLGD
jgi:hypothetical protein